MLIIFSTGIVAPGRVPATFSNGRRARLHGQRQRRRTTCELHLLCAKGVCLCNAFCLFVFICLSMHIGRSVIANTQPRFRVPDIIAITGPPIQLQVKPQITFFFFKKKTYNTPTHLKNIIFTAIKQIPTILSFKAVDSLAFK